MPATLILADHTGRLGNKLILFSHVIAAAEEYGCRVINLSILPAAHYFEGLHLNPLGEYPKRFFPIDLRWLFRVFRKPIQDWVRGRRGKPPLQNRWLTVLDMENKPVYRLDSPEFAALTRQSRWIILWGYPYRCPILVEKHDEKIKRFFRIRPQVAPIASKEFVAAADSGKRTVAIHIRQGDFRDWNHGKYYISPERMARAIHVADWVLNNPCFRVWVCSDEVVAEHLFPKQATVAVPRSLGEDLYILSNCHFVFGGFSTLSFFCAFLGNSVLLRVNPLIENIYKVDLRGLGHA